MNEWMDGWMEREEWEGRKGVDRMGQRREGTRGGRGRGEEEKRGGEKKRKRSQVGRLDCIFG